MPRNLACANWWVGVCPAAKSPACAGDLAAHGLIAHGLQRPRQTMARWTLAGEARIQPL